MNLIADIPPDKKPMLNPVLEPDSRRKPYRVAGLPVNYGIQKEMLPFGGFQVLRRAWVELRSHVGFGLIFLWLRRGL